MARKARELQPPAVWDVVRRVRRDSFSVVGVGEVDQRRRQNSAVFPAIGYVLLGGLLLGVSTGSFFPVLLHVRRWYKTTRLADHKQTER